MLGRIIGRCLRGIRLQKSVDFVATVQAEHPDRVRLRRDRLVVVRDGMIDKWVCFECPCGCGEKIQLPMSKSRRPRWSASIDWFGRIDLRPSVRQTAGCRAHFWVRRGRVEWCADSPLRADRSG